MSVAKYLLLTALTTLVSVPLSTASNVYFGSGIQLLAPQPGVNGGSSSLWSDGSFQSYAIGNCGCTPVPASVPTICAEINYKGQGIEFYSSSDCSGTNVWNMLGSWPVTAWITCGSFSYETNSVNIIC